jgi:crotonobetaine/carnitine-CoA ligase
MRWAEYLATQETFPQVVARMAKAHPDRLYATMVTGGEATWGQMEEAGRTWAARFLEFGVRSGDIVTTLIDSGIEALAVWLGLSKIGAIDAAVNSEYKNRMLVHAINNCAPAVILVNRPYLAQLEMVAGELTTLKHVLIADTDDAPSGSVLPGVTTLNQVACDAGRWENSFVMPRWQDISCISYTSGTTGPSKAVMLPWGQIHSVATGTYPMKDLSDADVFYSTTTHAHFGSKALPYLAAMKEGRAVLRSRFSLSSYWDDIQRHGVTTGSIVGTMAEMLVRSDQSPKGQTTLRNVFMAPLGPAYRKFNVRFGTRTCTVYNSSEGGTAINSGWDPDNENMAGRLREGYPGFEVRIVDENDYEVPDGKVGEFTVRSSVPWTMSAGYLNNPEATAKSWRNGWFHSGDAFMRTADGDYIFVDRMKDVIRRRGENISSYEVELDVLANPNIVECAAVATSNGMGDDEILLFAVKRADSIISPKDLHAELAVRMTKFMVPRYIEFLDSFPKTEATARIIKSELRARGVTSATWDSAAKARG